MLNLAELKHKSRLFLLTVFIHFFVANKLFAIPTEALSEAKSYFEKNKTQFPNKNFLVVIDYSQASNAKRFHLVDLKNNKTESYLTAHGKGSDPKHTGKATLFGDIEGSKMTSLGFFKTGETYMGQHGYTLRLDGLSPTNKAARTRLIVIHGASYVDPKRKVIGRSWGCPALEPQYSKDIIDKIKDGALIYAIN